MKTIIIVIAVVVFLFNSTIYTIENNATEFDITVIDMPGDFNVVYSDTDFNIVSQRRINAAIRLADTFNSGLYK